MPEIPPEFGRRSDGFLFGVGFGSDGFRYGEGVGVGSEGFRYGDGVGVGSEGFLYGDGVGVGSDGFVRLGTGVGVGRSKSSPRAARPLKPIIAILKNESASSPIPQVVLFIAQPPSIFELQQLCL